MHADDTVNVKNCNFLSQCVKRRLCDTTAQNTVHQDNMSLIYISTYPTFI